MVVGSLEERAVRGIRVGPGEISSRNERMEWGRWLDESQSSLQCHLDTQATRAKFISLEGRINREQRVKLNKSVSHIFRRGARGTRALPLAWACRNPLGMSGVCSMTSLGLI